MSGVERVIRLCGRRAWVFGRCGGEGGWREEEFVVGDGGCNNRLCEDPELNVNWRCGMIRRLRELMWIYPVLYLI